jgi:hypothetical protein
MRFVLSYPLLGASADDACGSAEACAELAARDQ